MSGYSRSSAERALKALSRVLIERVGGLDAAEAVLNSGGTRGVRRSQLANYYNPHCDQFLPIDLAARLEEVVGEPIVTAELARRAGRALAPREGAAGECRLQEVAEVSAEFGDLSAAMAGGLRDGELCAEDLARIEREAAHLHGQVADMLATVEAMRKPRAAAIQGIAP